MRFQLLGFPVGLGRPWALLLLLPLAAVGALALWQAYLRRKSIAGWVGWRGVVELTPGLSRWRSALKASLSVGGLTLAVIALAQPQCGTRTEWIKRTGVDVVLALDASKSMLARDVPPSRLERSKLELTAWLQELKGDRVGLVVFSGDAFVQCPLTSDYAAAAMFLRAVDPEQMQQGGTDIAGALKLALQTLERSDRAEQAGSSAGAGRDKVVVLISDGEETEGAAVEAAETLEEAGVKLYAVGVGSESGEPIPELNRRGEVTGYKKDALGNPVLTKLDRQGLAKLAEAGGGELFFRPRGVALKEVLDKLDRLQKGELESRLSVAYDERFQYFLFPGLLLLTAAATISNARRQKRPVGAPLEERS